MSSCNNATKRGRVVAATTAAIAVAWAAWFFGTPRRLSDDTTLPKGTVTAPTMSRDDSSSQLRVFVNISLNMLERIVNKILPQTLKIDQAGAKGTITRGTVAIAPARRSRLEIGGSAKFQGEKSFGPFTITMADLDFSGSSLGLHIDPDWTCRTAPDVHARLTRIDVKRAPDLLVQGFVNLFIDRFLPSVLTFETDLSVKPLAQVAWRHANRDIRMSAGAVTGVLSLRPEHAIVSEPLCDELRSELMVCLGIDFSTILSIGGDVAFVAHLPAQPLPPLDSTRPAPAVSRIRVPVVVKVDELSRYWQPQVVNMAGGSFRIDAVDFSESDGLLHGRMRFAFQPRRTTLSFLTPSIKGVVRFSLRPTCDPRLGQLRMTDFEFTEKSNSLLIDMLGAGANDVVRDGFEKFVPLLSDALMRRIEMEVRAEADGLIADAVAEWADAIPKLSAELRRAKSLLTGIVVKPISARAETGHVVAVIEVEANVTVELK